METIFEKSQRDNQAYSLPRNDPAFEAFAPPQDYLRESELALPEVSELGLMRHYSTLARRNMGIDTHFYPLGSCTMKYNPRVNELCAFLPGFARTHPLAPAEMVQGNLQVIWELIRFLCELCGMSGGSLLPNAGAQGEFVGVQLIKAYHRSRGDLERTEILIPDNAHGTNPATARMAGFSTVPIRTNEAGDLDLEELRASVSQRTAGLMLTNPNTLGLFSPVITEIASIIHAAGGLLYYDGANLNPMLNIVRVGEMGFDVLHINLHKTFSTPHGGGGPGSGPVLCNERLVPFLPVPRVEKAVLPTFADRDSVGQGLAAGRTFTEKVNESNNTGESYTVSWKGEPSIGQIASFHGNFAIYLRAYLYAKLHGHYGLRKVAEQAVLNANYLKARIAPLFAVPFSRPCMHEFVVQADRYLDRGIRALDIAKRLLDYGMHAPTIYFPLIIKECMLIEPTETESKAVLDHFIEALEKIIEEIESDPEQVKQAPQTLPVSRLDEVAAAKHPVLRHPIIERLGLV